MINAQSLIEKFQYALDKKWGYIWGSAGTAWTQTKQDQKVAYMKNKYGSNWKSSSAAKKDNYYNAAKYGSKWIGHTVADCSGLFVWAFKQLGGSIYHGSNSIYARYCSKKGKMTSEIYKTIKPGTAVFTGTEKSHGHIGLYIGNGKCIEASGTQAGVCTSKLTASKWTFWGELSGVDYTNSVATPVETPTTTQEVPATIRKGSQGILVQLAQNLLDKLGYNLGVFGIDGKFGTKTELATKDFQKKYNLVVDGIIGKNTWTALFREYDKLPEEKKNAITSLGLPYIGKL